ncbi:uncharacterized protein LOC131858420 [Cryptomeria japonica]|uniref:uncharacterized protein LOC131858420 n=1 Tax=Cryptomeria japonica TaxID=3369 RepID=UPI0027DA0894|nr:uncharacterized protein LOC131858420 [Cryptomeria japonica]
MTFGGYKKFPHREDGSPYRDKFENLKENPFYNLNTKDDKGGHNETLTTKKHEDIQLDEIIHRMADLNGNESKMAKALKRQSDWVLQKFGLERDAIQSPNSIRQYNNHDDDRRTNSGEITGNWNNRDRINNVSNNGGNQGNNGNYGKNGNGDNQNGNNNNGGGNNVHNGNNGGYRNY